MRKQGSCLEKEIMQGTMPGARRRKRPRTAWMDNIKTWTGLSMKESVRMIEDRDNNRRMTFKVIQGYWKWHESIGHMILPISGVYSNNVSILHNFFDTTTFTVYATACRGAGPNFETYFIFRKQLRLKTTYTFLFMHTHKVSNTCHVH